MEHASQQYIIYIIIYTEARANPANGMLTSCTCSAVNQIQGSDEVPPLRILSGRVSFTTKHVEGRTMGVWTNCIKLLYIIVYLQKRSKLAFLELKDTDQVLREKMKETTSSVTIHGADVISTFLYRGL